eukprot:6200862-Pleurochrysis_carterae.AAC.2
MTDHSSTQASCRPFCAQRYARAHCALCKCAACSFCRNGTLTASTHVERITYQRRAACRKYPSRNMAHVCDLRRVGSTRKAPRPLKLRELFPAGMSTAHKALTHCPSALSVSANLKGIGLAYVRRSYSIPPPPYLKRPTPPKSKEPLARAEIVGMLSLPHDVLVATASSSAVI